MQIYPNYNTTLKDLFEKSIPPTQDKEQWILYEFAVEGKLAKVFVIMLF